jgi:2-polyprenyl-3-methyl-5-hydroxy-6-metoxy-1,4-benzoquinol methylase
MIETNIKNLSVEEIMQKIKQEVKKRTEQNYPDETSKILKSHIENSCEIAFAKVNIIDNKEEPFIQKEVYEYADFTKYHDVEFIKNCYRGLLKREADMVGLEYYLKLLRNGEKNKSEIISILRYSKEGKAKNVKLLGSKKRYAIAVINSLPVFGTISKWFITFLTLPKLLKRLNQYENFTYQLYKKNNDNAFKLQTALNKNIQENLDNLNNCLNIKADKTEVESIQTKLESKADKTELELYLQTVSYAKEYMKISQQNMQNLIDEAKKRLPKELLNQKELLKITEEEKYKFDNFYIEFEDKFRGSREEIKQRLEIYLPYIEKLPFKKEEFKALDVGCGRGEWLELLKEQGYNAQGIDLNRIMVAKSQELGLDVKKADVIEYLKLLEDESLSVITGFHIIEHLPFEILMKMFEESYRVLKKGGMVIFETPNPENLIVGACNFYTDPTHRNPLVPQTSQFLLKSCGFEKCDIQRFNLMKEVNYIEGEEFSDVNDLLYAFSKEQDYAVIGYKL